MLLSRHPRLWKTGAVEITRLTVEFGNELGQLLTIPGGARILFGIGMPSHHPSMALVRMDSLDAGETEKAKIRSGNAISWLRPSIGR